MDMMADFKVAIPGAEYDAATPALLEVIFYWDMVPKRQGAQLAQHFLAKYGANAAIEPEVER
jgi:hypothetical protein